MARIRQVRITPLDSLFDVLGVGNNDVSLPMTSIVLQAKVAALAAEKYDKPLQRITPKFMRESVGRYPDISFVNRKPFEVEVFVVHIEGRKVTFWLTFDLFGSPESIGPLLRYIHEHLPIDSGMRVKYGNLIGDIELPQEPIQVTNIQTRRITYFLGDEKETKKFLVRRKIVSVPR